MEPSSPQLPPRTRSRGQKYVAPAFAFFEMLIWPFAVRQIMQNLDNPFYYFAYAFGFATGVVVVLNVRKSWQWDCG